jgi:hypothetical protein
MGIMRKEKIRKSAKSTLAEVTREMAKPRVAESAREPKAIPQGASPRLKIRHLELLHLGSSQIPQHFFLDMLPSSSEGSSSREE